MIVKILGTVLPVFITLAIGILCRNKNLISRDGINAVKNIAVNITLPAVFLQSFAAADYAVDTIKIPIAAFLITALGLLLGYVGKSIFKEKHCYPFMITSFETGMLGYGLFALLFKGESNSMLALLDLGTAAFVLTIYKTLLCGHGGAKQALRSAIVSPTLWGMVIGLVIGVTGLYDWMEVNGSLEVFNTVTEFIGAPTSVLILLGIGYDLDFSSVRWSRVLRITASRIVVLGIMLGCYILLNNTLLRHVIPMSTLALYLIMPPSYIVPAFADNEDERADISATLSLCTVLCLVCFAVMAAVV